jgi:hypothetical protein
VKIPTPPMTLSKDNVKISTPHNDPDNFKNYILSMYINDGKTKTIIFQQLNIFFILKVKKYFYC